MYTKKYIRKYCCNFYIRNKMVIYMNYVRTIVLQDFLPRWLGLYCRNFLFGYSSYKININQYKTEEWLLNIHEYNGKYNVQLNIPRDNVRALCAFCVFLQNVHDSCCGQRVRIVQRKPLNVLLHLRTSNAMNCVFKCVQTTFGFPLTMRTICAQRVFCSEGT